MPTIEVSEEAFQKIESLRIASGKGSDELLTLAIHELDRSWVGRPPPLDPPIPFKKTYSNNDADVVLRQLDPKNFCLEEGFRYLGPEAQLLVPRGDATDLASVPAFMTWLVPRYGRHSLPALLHDRLVVPGMPTQEREKADAIFRDTMTDTGVPFVRRWLMWAAVSVGTLTTRNGVLRYAIGLWLSMYGLAGLAGFALAAGWWEPNRNPSVSVITSVLVSPLLLSCVWLKRYKIGVITAYALLVLSTPVLFVLITSGVYALVEQAAKLYLRTRGAFGSPQRINPVRTSNL